MKRGTPKEHDSRIEAVLARVAAKRGFQAGEGVTHYTPLSALLAAEEGFDAEEANRVRSETIAAVIDYALQDGPHPSRVMKNIYALVHALRPQAMPGEWTCRDYGELFGETKAAHSWRVKQLFGGEGFAARGIRPIKARFQKSAEASAKYAAAQKGNTNRRHGLPVTAMAKRERRERDEVIRRKAA